MAEYQWGCDIFCLLEVFFCVQKLVPIFAVEFQVFYTLDSHDYIWDGHSTFSRESSPLRPYDQGLA